MLMVKLIKSCYNCKKLIHSICIEDNIFYGKIENITDLVLFDGKTVEEAFHYFVESVEDYIDFCKELGKTIDFKEGR